MLERVVVRDFSLLRQVDIDLGPGLTVITGQSGAGKTLLFDAISFALGGRPHRSLLAAGATSCEIELHLRLDARKAQTAGDPWREGGNILVRKYTATGRGQQSVNGAAVTIAQLQQAIEQWFEITGQFESRILYNNKAHRILLDAFGDAKLTSQLAQYREQYKLWRDMEAKLAALRESAANRAQEMDFLGFQIHELAQANVQYGERTEVESRLRMLQNAGQLIAAADTAARLLGGNDEAEGAYDLAARALEQIMELARLLGAGPTPIGDAVALEAQAGEVLENLREVAARCSDIASEIQHDPAELQQLLERVDDILRLERKYGCAADDLPGLLQDKQARFELLSDPGLSLEVLADHCLAARERTLIVGKTVSLLREAAAAKLVKTTAKHFRRLDFPHVEMQVDIASTVEPGPDGLDNVELLITLNTGEPARPLAQVASGGEASRILLGLKAALAGHTSTQVLLLDEVEAGLGADTAAHVALVLCDLAAGRQVLAITHLPVVAASGAAHLAVRKTQANGHAVVSIEPITGAIREEELMRMLGGAGDEETAALARKLIS